MTLKEGARESVSESRAAPRILGGTAAACTFAFVLTSSLVAVLPAFEFESQFPALLPFFLWAAAAGLGHLANLGRRLLDPWRAALGLASLVPYGALMLLTTALPRLDLPWWLALVTATAAALPPALVGLRTPDVLRTTARPRVTSASLRGTFLVGLALMFMVWGVGGPPIVSMVAAVLLACALTVAGLSPHGLAHASTAWGIRNWLALAWGSVVVWLAVPLSTQTRFFVDPWYLGSAMLLAGLPLILANRADAQATQPQA